jgi:hypothetical protein
MAVRDANLGEMVFDHVDAINNADIINLVSLLDTGFQQFSTCPSATRNDCQKEDVAIVKGWIAMFKQRFAHFAGQPVLYMPKASPKPKNLPYVPVVKIVQNSALQNLMYNMSHLRTELLHSEDAENLNGFHQQTAKVVVDPWIAKFEAFADLMEENLGNPEMTWMPDTDIQEPGYNPNTPR